MSLNEKNILLIAPKFFDYDLCIENELKARGAIVFRLYDRPFNNIIFKLLSRAFPKLISYLLIPYYKLKVNYIKAPVSQILVINGQTLHRKLLKYLKDNLTPENMILYMWDSMENRPSVKDCLDIYDRKLSFDPESCRKYTLKLRPLFFVVDSNVSIYSEAEFDVAFVGTAHSDRFEVLNLISAQLHDKKFYIHLYLQSRLIYFIRRYFLFKYSKSTIDSFNYNALSRTELREVLNKTNILLDIEHPFQDGLTSRNIEYLKYNKKIITTNFAVQKYDFYKSGNILIIDRNSPCIPEKFIYKPFVPYSTKILSRYSVQSFVNDCLFSDLGAEYGRE